jgi:FKBP-type peptidyl-prolyl cis-trans isomerase (trigger factor)
MQTFKIVKDSIKPDGTLQVAFSVDGKLQNLSGMPVGDEKALEVALNEYGEAYARGLEMVAPVEIKPEVKALENKDITLQRYAREVVEEVIKEEEVIIKK